MGRFSTSLWLVLTLVTLLSCSRCGLSFLRPQTCTFSLDSHPRQAKTSFVRRHAATTVSGGVPSGNRERGKNAASSVLDKNVVPSGGQRKAPSVSADTPTASPFPNQPPPLSMGESLGDASANSSKEATTAAAGGKHAPRVEIRSGASTAQKMGAEESAGASSSSTPKSAPAPKLNVVTVADAGASSDPGAGKAAGSAVAMGGEQAARAAGTEEVTASAATVSKKERDLNLAAGPETTAAEKVLTLLDIGLVGKEEVSAYYDALSELERTTREAKAAAAVAASSPNPSARPASAMPFSARDGPLSLVPLPAVCAALGAAGTQSLHLAGGVGTAISVFGAMAGVAIGGLVVIGDDPLGRLARAAGAAVVRSTGAAGGAAGKSVSESVAGAAGAAAGAVENAVVKAPSNFVGGLARSISGAVTAAFGSAVALPGVLVTKAADGAKGALKDTSDAVVAIPGQVARKASRVAESALQTTSAAAAAAVGGALQSTSEAAVTAVKASPEKAAQAAQRLNGPISTPGKSLADFISLPSRAGAGASKKAEKVQRAATAMPPTSVGSASTAAPSRRAEEEEPGGIPVQELEAKMLSVKKALERFDNVKARIEKAETSGTLFEAVGVTRSMNVSAEMEEVEKARAAAADAAAVAQRAKETPMESRSSSPATKPTRPTPTKSKTATKRQTAADQDRRKQVAEGLLEKASQRAAEAKAGLKAAAASARRGADEVKPSAVAASVAGGGASDL